MKVLFCVRHNFHSSPGGAQIQILKTKAGLEKLGVHCDLTTTPYGVDYAAYDILHLTDLTWIYDILEYLQEIQRSGCSSKKVLSTIYWPFDDYAANGAPPLQSMVYRLFGVGGFERAKAAAKFLLRREKIYLKGVFNNYIDTQRKIVQSVDMLLPNSELEFEALAARLNVKKPSYRVVNNAVDTTVFDAVAAASTVTRRDDLVTFVARIDARKNQMGFLRSVMNETFTIRFIGNPGPNSEGYFGKLKALAKRRGNVEFFSHLSQEEVFQHMLEAKANVLTSWIETPGLVSLEAAYAGCNIVVSAKGSVKDYFRDYAYYCDPADETSMRSAVNLALSSDYNPQIRALISSEYSWDYAAKQTFDAYHSVLSGSY
ncbi:MULTISPECIES: glycosyltransferase family 4 protein [Pseudomonas]|uniref:glycosyltransferase family 4 protein n=1 Tax=Pseudomonas TaxID=286 RepID=UPI000C2A097E|nr:MULTISPECIES: glycosyltransferase family 4 protein [Pseudomonas]MCP3752121.1 glycosyltransferase family 4 protein [Pseudomonas sp. SBB6]PJY97762.1 hypothetical protein COO64_06660 [Pseudomonas donghuensis]WKY27030.1 glycosyltransferase family 4 protein [Pseudomonas donghuensis]